MRTDDEYGNLYQMLEFSSPEFGRPPTGRCPTLRLHRTRLDNGPLVIAVLVPGPTPGDPWAVGSYITRSRLRSDQHPGPGRSIPRGGEKQTEFPGSGHMGVT
jgi:hypothetical protein